MKYKLDSIMFELTRFCNMECPHCIRGEMQKGRISKKTITKVLESIGDYIPVLMFTGGEPALAVDLIEYTLSECQRLNISVGNFWMATNGMIHSKKFFNAIRSWLKYTSDSEINGIRISIDPYHDKINSYYFREFEEELQGEGININFEYSGAPKDTKNLIAGGRAADSGWGNRCIEHSIHLYTEDDMRIEGEVYINIKGDIISTCDISYDEEDSPESDFNLGNIHEMDIDLMYDEFFKRHPERID